MKNRRASEWDFEKKIRRVEKGTKKVDKYRKSLYNMLSDEDNYYEESLYEDEYSSGKKRSEVNRNDKRR